MPGYTVVDALAGATLAPWVNLNLNVRNLLDRAYPASTNPRAVAAQGIQRGAHGEHAVLRAGGAGTPPESCVLYSTSGCLALTSDVPEWRNWQTRGTQNPVGFTPRVGSIPSSGTIRLGRYAPSLMASHFRQTTESSGVLSERASVASRRAPASLRQPTREGGRLGKPAAPPRGVACPVGLSLEKLHTQNRAGYGPDRGADHPPSETRVIAAAALAFDAAPR